MWIKIPVCCCTQAKALGRQYTKRLLPDFLIPFARMRLDAVVEASRRKESGRTREECCRILGCIDLRTARMHMRRLEEAAKTAALTLAERQATMLHLHEPEDRFYPLDPLGRLEELLDRQEEAHLRAGGGRSRPPALRRLLQAVLWKNRAQVPGEPRKPHLKSVLIIQDTTLYFSFFVLSTVQATRCQGSRPRDLSCPLHRGAVGTIKKEEKGKFSFLSCPPRGLSWPILPTVPVFLLSLQERGR